MTQYLFFLYFCIAAIPVASAQQAAPDRTWSVRALPLPSVLDSITTRTGVSFSYDFDLIRKRSISAEIDFYLPVEQICKELFADQELDYEILDAGHIRLLPVIPERNPDETEVRLIDAVTGQPVRYAAVAFDMKGGAETDSLGMFLLPAEGVREITFYHIGYRRKEISASNARHAGIISLDPAEKDLADIIVLEDEPGIKTSDGAGATIIRQSRLLQNNSSVFTADPLRTIQLLPGMGAQNDLSSEIRIRGGDADESLVLLDGMTLYEAKHYYGIFSTINAGVVDEIAVYKNNTPVSMEGRTSGVVDISTYPAGDPGKSFLDLQAGLMNAGGSTVFRVGKRFYMMAGGRFTTGNPGQSRFQRLLNPRPARQILERDFSTTNIVSQVPDYAFQDWNGKLVWELSDRINLYATTFHSHDETELQFDRTVNVRVANKEVPVFREDYDEAGSWNNHAYQAGVQVELNPKTRWDTRVVRSDSDSESMLESLVWRRLNKDSTFTGRYANMISNQISDLHAFSTLTIGQQDQNVFTAGMDIQHIDNAFRIDYGDRRQFDQEQSSTLFSLHAAKKLHLWKNTGIDIGIRASRYDQTGKVYVSPQVLITRDMAEGQKIKLSYSSPAQFMQRAYYEDLTGRAYTFWINANDVQVPVSRAQKWMAGYQAVYQRFKWDAEVFYKRTTGIIEIASNQIGFDPQTSGINANTQLRVFTGNSRSFGIDLLGILELGNLSSQLSYTWSRTDQQFPAILDNTWIPARDDSRHQLKFAHTYRLKKWSLQALWVFASGRPYTDISKLAGNIRNRLETDPSVFQTRLKDYHRVDLGVSYTIELPVCDVYLNAAVLNVFNRRNVKYAQYIFGLKGGGAQATNTIAGTEWGLLDRTFNLSAGVRF